MTMLNCYIEMFSPTVNAESSPHCNRALARSMMMLTLNGCTATQQCTGDRCAVPYRSECARICGSNTPHDKKRQAATGVNACWLVLLWSSVCRACMYPSHGELAKRTEQATRQTCGDRLLVRAGLGLVLYCTALFWGCSLLAYRTVLVSKVRTVTGLSIRSGVQYEQTVNFETQYRPVHGLTGLVD